MSESVPDVSAVIATYNMGQYVAEAIRSVLAQPMASVEVVVVDDGSTDNTLQALSVFQHDPRVRVIAQENLGQPKAKNAGIRASRGRFIAFCDADDYWLPNKLALQLPLFDNRPRVGVVCSNTLTLHEDGTLDSQPRLALPRGHVLDEMFLRNMVPFGTAVVRRECLEQVGLFDESISMGIDWDLWLRVAVDWEFDFVPEPTFVYRVWDGQMSKNWRGRYESAFRIMENFLSRHQDRVSPGVVATAFADTHTNLAAAELTHLGIAPCLASIRRALQYRATYIPTWRLLALMPWYRWRATRQ